MSSEEREAEASGAAAGSSGSARTGHGWWPYLLPYAGFLLTVEVSSRYAEAWPLTALFVKPLVPAALMLFFFARGAYPELRRPRLHPGLTLADVALGVGLAVVWMAPFELLPALRPEGPGFDPGQAGAGNEAWVLSLRLLGFALVTPFFEELFIRSFVMRYADIYPGRGDFRKLPLARYTRRSFLATVVIFTIGHVPWEWWVCVPWVVVTNLWFYYRRDLYAVIVLHAATNATILLAAMAAPFGLDLWYFV